METFLTISIFLAVMGIFYFLGMREKNSSWKGVLENKYSETKRARKSLLKQTRYYWIFKTDEGKTIKKEVFSESGYNMFNIGDRIEKKKGEFVPVKIS